MDGFFLSVFSSTRVLRESSLSEQLALGTQMGSPVVVFTLGCEDQAVTVKLSLAEDVDVLEVAVGYALGVEVLATDGDDADLGDGGLCEVAHDGPFSWLG
jgi:hypothetical protein